MSTIEGLDDLDAPPVVPATPKNADVPRDAKAVALDEEIKQAVEALKLPQ